MMGISRPLPNLSLSDSIGLAIQSLLAGQVIAYPTEGVFGLGCIWQNEAAVSNLLELKQRPVEKGLILVAADWDQVSALVLPPPERLQAILRTWPGPITWVFPASPQVPIWIRGEHTSLAVRISAHPIVQALCLGVGQAIVSTSANQAGCPALCRWQAVWDTFGQMVGVVIPEDAGDLVGPTPIYDAMTGEQLR